MGYNEHNTDATVFTVNHSISEEKWQFSSSHGESHLLKSQNTIYHHVIFCLLWLTGKDVGSNINKSILA